MKLLKCTIVVAASVLAASTAYAAERFPTKPIRVVVPFPPGAASDFLARVVGQRLGDIYGQQDVREQFLKGGSEPAFGSAEDFLKLQRAEYARIGKLVQDLGIKVQ